VSVTMLALGGRRVLPQLRHLDGEEARKNEEKMTCAPRRGPCSPRWRDGARSGAEVPFDPGHEHEEIESEPEAGHDEARSSPRSR